MNSSQYYLHIVRSPIQSSPCPLVGVWPVQSVTFYGRDTILQLGVMRFAVSLIRFHDTVPLMQPNKRNYRDGGSHLQLHRHPVRSRVRNGGLVRNRAKQIYASRRPRERI